MDFSLTGRTALVIGASRGIGLATVQALTAEGMHVAACARSTGAPLTEATSLVRQADLTSPAQTTDLVEWAVDELGGIDLLVNNVGGSPARIDGFRAISDDDWQHAFEVNFFSAHPPSRRRSQRSSCCWPPAGCPT